jgi:hypothetical protein
MFFVTLVALLLFSLMQLPARLSPEFHPDIMDGVRGLFLGVAIAALWVSTRKARRC